MSLGDRLRALDAKLLRGRPYVPRPADRRLAFLRSVGGGRTGMLGYAEAAKPLLVEQARELVALREEVERLAARVAELEARGG